MNSFLNPLMNPALAAVPAANLDAKRHVEGRAGGMWSFDDLRDSLDRLIQICNDGYEGYKYAAEHAQSEWLQSQFLLYSKQREQFAAELANLVNSLGIEPSAGTSLEGTLRRAWMDLQTAITGHPGDDKVILEECEQGEDSAKQAYEAELDRGLPEHIHNVVHSQYQDVLRVHNDVREMRDSYPR